MNQLDLFAKRSIVQVEDPSLAAHRFSKVYYNTTDLHGKELRKEQTNAGNQDEVVLKFFKASPYQTFTPYEVYFGLGQQFDRNSVRRAITDLTTAGYLVKTDERRKSPAGKMNYCWRLTKNHDTH